MIPAHRVMVMRKPLNSGPATPSQSPEPGNPWNDRSINHVSEEYNPQPHVPPSPGHNISRKDVPRSSHPVTEQDNMTNRDTVEGAGGQSDLDRVPSVLRPGGAKAETNPFLRKKISDTADGHAAQPPTGLLANIDLNDSAGNPWLESGTSQSHPIHGQLLRHETGTSLTGDHLLPISSEAADTNTWTDIPTQPSGQPPPPPGQAPPPIPSPALISVNSEDEEGDKKGNAPTLPPIPIISDEFTDERQAWDDLGGGRDNGKSKATEDDDAGSGSDDWNMIDSDQEDEPARIPDERSSDMIPVASEEKSKSNDEPRPQAPSLENEKQIEPVDLLTGPVESTASSQTPPALVSPAVEEIPPLPPRGIDRPKWTPTRQPVDGASETYQIKNIRWFDHNAKQNPRISPILIQNANGPCPLVALVNALLLTTVPDVEDTALVSTLRSREQVSLNLLLDAVFDELMSPRRMDSEAFLPDVGDLYAFLQSLHTGMNVNPRFIPTPEVLEVYRGSPLTHLDASERDDFIPGTFENTGEMGLYATFSIPLIHGWLPRKDDSVYDSLGRQAATYEDVQNLLFREEELEDKLSTDQGLTEQEQELYHDIVIIKDFLALSATQLTPWGIEVISKAMRPGTFAILFRNDHFSTLYSHPESQQLLTLVTDAGYKTHDEIIWESLSDVNGVQSQLLSGDFRHVSGDGAGSSSHMAGASSAEGGQWTTVQQGKRKSKPVPADDDPLNETGAEQEDRDLALALQLQEEEDQRHREHEARRQRESELSEQYIEQQARQTPPENRNNNDSRRRSYRFSAGNQAAARQSSGNVSSLGATSTTSLTSRQGSSAGAPAQPSRPRQVSQPQRVASAQQPNLPPRRPGIHRAPETVAPGDEPPPSYEQARNDRAYRPPVGHPSHEDSRTDQAQQASRTPAANGSGGAAGQGPPYGPGRAPGVGVHRNRECVVM